MSAELTLGAEEELHLIDLDSWHLSASAPTLLNKLASESYAAELQRTTVETNSRVVRSLGELRDELVRLRRGLMDVAGPLGVGIAAVGTAPCSEISDFELTPSQRFGAMQEKYRLLVDEQLICGFQVHVGVSDRDLAVQLAQRVAEHLPTLLALSASSPFWNGHDTGYASVRSLVWQRWPSAGATGPLASAAEYDELIADLIATGVISDDGMAYFDIRPSAHAPTLELRVCDALPLVDDAVLIAGLFRAAVRAAEIDIENGVPLQPRRAPVQRAALWQAARTGLSSELLSAGPRPRPIQAGEAVRSLVESLRPVLHEFDEYEVVRDLAEQALDRGNSSDRQRAAFARRQSLDDVMRLVVDETESVGAPPRRA
jgi:carboxylate-amine ligase